MAKKEKVYNKLPGKRSSIVGTHTLWEGPDHLLSVTSTMASESYKRFYYQDIQAVVSRKTIKGKVTNVLFGLVCLVLFVLGRQIGMDDGGGVFIGFGVMGVCIFVIHLILGPTCEVYLRTAVQKEKLPALNRLGKARKCLNRLKPIIEAAQGSISRDELQAHVARRKRTPGPREKSPSPPAGGGVVAGVRHEEGNVHKVLFVVVFMGALAMAAALAFKHIALSMSTMLIFVGALALAIIALVKQHESDLKRPLCNTTWAALVYVSLVLLRDYVFSMIAAFRSPRFGANQWELLKDAARMSLADNPFATGVYLFFILGALVLSIYGMFLAFGRQDGGASSSG